MIYGSETWAMRKEHEDKILRAENRMVRWMLGTPLADLTPSIELKARLGVECVSHVMRRARLRWFGHVARKSEEDWVRRVTSFAVEGTRPAGRPTKTWRETVEADLKALQLDPRDTANRLVWRQAIHRDPSNLGRPRKRTLNR